MMMGIGQTLSVDTLPSDQSSFDASDNAIINAAAGAIPVQGGGTVANPTSQSAVYVLLALAAGTIFLVMSARK